MKRLWWLIMILAALVQLCACSRAETVWETVDDDLEQETVGEAPMRIVFDVPPEAEQVGVLDDCRVYAQGDGDYEITARTLACGDVREVIRAVSGFEPERLRTVLRQDGLLPQYSFCWYTETDGGGRLYRAEVLADTDYCYALVFGVREGLGTIYDSIEEQVFASFGLISDEMV